jgi:hypothetical protein
MSKLDAKGTHMMGSIDFGELCFTDSPNANISGQFGYGLGSGKGWCVYRFETGEVYEGFMDNARINGWGCLQKPLGKNGLAGLGFYKGEWRDGKLLDGIFIASDGSAPLQYQCKTQRHETVRGIARALAQRMRATGKDISAFILAEEITRLSSGLNPALSSSSRLLSHTILLLPEHLGALASLPAKSLCGKMPAQDIYVAGPALGRRFDFLMDKIVEVRTNPPRHAESIGEIVCSRAVDSRNLTL